ncbi:MAG TPA: 3-oxoacyl-[acyl-carrier-protein] reductase [Terriglobales bacterium]|nr:3-oxoacyl-[acyl-carrier-protein] reductase [Terriglobales bacterium]
MKPFVINRHGRIVFPGNFFPELDFSVFDTLEQFMAVMTRDFGDKAPTETDIATRMHAGQYENRYEVCRDLALDLFWVNRYVLTMYEKRPTRWRDLPRHRDDIFLPLFKPWDKATITTALENGYRALPMLWDEQVEDECFRILLNVFRNKQSAGGALRAIKPTVAEILARPENLTYHLLSYDRDYPGYDYDDVINYSHPVPELEALMRQAMILHNQYRWDPATSHCIEVGKLRDDDYVVAFYPRSQEVLQFIRRVKNAHDGHAPAGRPRSSRPPTLALSKPVQPYPPLVVRERFAIMPRLEAIAVYEGEIPVTNADLIRNHAYCWSRMSELEIAEKTGIEERRYSELSLEDMALLAAREALAKSGRRPAEIGAVFFCSCTSTKIIPSVACWLSGELGLFQTHASCDIVAACAGMPYGFSEAVRVLQEIERPVLVVCAEKFSDKLGTVRTSRMLFGDGAAAVVIGPAPAGAPPDIEVLQTYASGPWSEVNSIIWPNPEFDNNLTVYGPEVKALAQRYLTQMIGELNGLPHSDGRAAGSLLDAVDLVVPHQANKKMVVSLSEEAGVPADRLYFNIQRVGNTSAASILMAIYDAVREGVIDRPMRVFAPGFGAGAVGGYVVMRVDPAIVSRDVEASPAVEDDLDEAVSLKGKVALVTGASRGIGRAIALEMAHRGAAVAINYRSDATHAESAAKEIRDMGGECMLIQGDVSKKDEARRIVKEVLDRWLRLDILVNNAGITRDRSLKRMTDDDWAEVISVNLNGTFYTTSAALPAMMNQRFGRIINISSVVGQAGAFGQANYSASKGGIIAFTKTVALETARYNITANVIAPGYTLTDMVQAIPKEIAAQAKARIPLGRFAEPEEIAEAAGFLAADADYITGQELNVNGGFHM